MATLGGLRLMDSLDSVGRVLALCVVFIIIIIIVSLFVVIRIIAVVVRIQPFVL